MSPKFFGCGAALLCGTALTAPAFAQTSAQQQMQQQIQSLQQQMQDLQQRLGTVSTQVQQQQNEISVVRTAQPQAVQDTGWRVGLFNGRPGIYSADGATGLALTGRLQFDVGHYWQNSEPGVGGATGTDQRTQKDLNSGFNVRRARLGVLGQYANDWKFAFVTEFGNINTAGVTQAGAGAANPVPGATAVTGQILTASLTYAGFKNVALTAGYTDVFDTFSEAVSSADITFNERPAISNLVLNLAGSEPRAAFGATAWGDRWYGEFWVTGPQNTVPTNGQQAAIAGRGGFLPWKAADSFLAIGTEGSYVFIPPHNDAATGTAGNGLVPVGKTTFTFSERPELRIDPTNSITTGAINASSAATYGGEFAAEWRNLWIDGEFDYITVNQIAATPTQTLPTPTLNFSGYYVETGYFITGEQRPYSTTNGAWGSLRPLAPFSLSGSGFGAWEVAARYSYANLNSGSPFTGGIFGGRQTIAQLGLNWYPVSGVRFLLDYLNAGVDRKASPGAPAGQTPGKTNLATSFQALVFRTQVNW